MCLITNSWKWAETLSSLRNTGNNELFNLSYIFKCLPAVLLCIICLIRAAEFPIDFKICIKSQKATGNSCSSGAEGILHTSTWLFLIQRTLFPFKGRLGFFKGYPCHQTFLAVNRECMRETSVWEGVCFVRGTACISFLIFPLQIAVQHITRGLLLLTAFI